MNAGSLFLLAILVPVLLAALLLAPIYLGMFGAAYIVYTPPSGANPILDKFTDVFYIIDAYEQLFGYWMANKASLSTVQYTLPVIVLPVVCTLFGLWLTRKVSRKLLDFFYAYAAGGN